MLKIKEVQINFNPLEVYNILKNEKNTILLDSSNKDEVLSKFSFIGINPFKIFEAKGKKVFVDNIEVNGEPFDVLDNLIKKYYNNESGYSNIPLLSGAIGYISYDTCRILENIPNKSLEDFNISDMRFIFYNNIIIFDLINNKQFITSLNGKEDEIRYILNRINKCEHIEDVKVEEVKNKFISNFNKEDYKKCVRKLKNYIVSGDVYIANMTQRFYTESNEDSFEIYKKLRSINKAPFSAFLNFNDFQIISS